MKKLFTKATAAAIAAAMIIGVGVTASASKFPDVTATNYSWAMDAIESMADKGIITGYSDGTFNPSKTVSKLESLVLISRILGCNEDVNESLTSSAWDIYCEELNEYNLPYGNNEIAYLLMKRVITSDELDDYIGENNRDDGLKRYEVATLLTKALDATSTLSSDIVSNLNYTDTSDIPSASKKYVAYVTEQGLMQGMSEDTFAPNESVTRAQAAVVLYKLMDKTAYEFKSGIVTVVDQTTRLIKATDTDGEIISNYANAGVMLRYNGENIGINDVEVGYNATFTFKSERLYAIDFSDAKIDEIVYGSFVGSSTSTAKGTTINIYPIKDTDTDLMTTKKESFKIGDDCVISSGESISSLSTIKAGAYIKLTIKKGVVEFVEILEKTKKISGRVNEVVIDPVYKLIIEDNDGNVKDYLVSSVVTVKKNGSTASARDILAGDSVSLGVQYDRITDITATSKTKNKTGIIKEVIISNSPRITLTSDGIDTTYFVSNETSIKLNGTASTFYDLRVGVPATVTLESDTITSIETTATNEVTTREGTVLLVNSSYGLLQIEYVDSSTGATRTESVFVKSNASIVNYNTQKTVKLSTITPGSKVTVTGSIESGVFEAGTVVIIG